MSFPSSVLNLSSNVTQERSKTIPCDRSWYFLSSWLSACQQVQCWL
jgi:hypothetical protein